MRCVLLYFFGHFFLLLCVDVFFCIFVRLAAHETNKDMYKNVTKQHNIQQSDTDSQSGTNKHNKN